MAVVTCRRAVGGENYTDNLRQVVKLQRGMYGVMLARYTLPKLVKKFNSEEEEQKMFLSFVVTHDRMNQQLPHFSEAFIGIRPTLFYDPVTQKMSNYVAIVHALTGIAKEQIAPENEGSQPYEVDWDLLIGRPGFGLIEPRTKPDKNGLFGNNLKSLDPADAALKKAMKPLWEARKTAHTTNGDLLHLTYPATAYQDDADVTDPHTSGKPPEGSAFEGDDMDQIPF